MAAAAEGGIHIDTVSMDIETIYAFFQKDRYMIRS
jgi:hypothetical protein